MRLVYYCVVQTLTRLSSTWYQLQYGFHSADEYDADKSTSMETAIYLSEFVFSPGAGIGYLMVFLLIQPDALVELRQLLCPPHSDTYTHTNSRKNGSGAESLLSSSHGDSETDMSSSVHNSSLSRPSVRLGGEEGQEQVGEGEGDTTPRTSSTQESMFPLLDMDEDDLAREIDRRYNPNHSHRSLLSDKW